MGPFVLVPEKAKPRAAGGGSVAVYLRSLMRLDRESGGPSRLRINKTAALHMAGGHFMAAYC